MESNFDIAALFASLGFLELSILILTAFFASVVSGISGYGGGMTLGLLVSPFIPVKLLVPLMSVFVLFSNLSRMYYYRKNIFWKKGFYFAIISTPFLIAGTNFYAAVSEKTLYFCLGFGIAFLLNDNLQLDFGTTFNFKETPTIFQMSLGVSYRLNLYKEK